MVCWLWWRRDSEDVTIDVLEHLPDLPEVPHGEHFRLRDLRLNLLEKVTLELPHRERVQSVHFQVLVLRLREPTHEDWV